MYQSKANDEEDGLKLDQFQPSELNSTFRYQDYLKVLVFLSLSFALSFIAFSDKNSGVSPFANQPSISHITSLEDIPREAVLGAYSETDQAHLFGLFLKKYGRSYSSPSDYSARFSIFKSSLQKADDRNGKEKSRSFKSARHGITKFSDLTEEEFKTTKKGRLPTKAKSDSDSRNSGGKTETTIDEDFLLGIPKMATVPKYEGTLTNVDWSGIYTTSIRDQGYCGSCWAFSTASQMESDAIRAGLLTTNDVLSVQQFVSCDTEDWQCEGGWTEMAFSYAMENGIMLENDFPYTSYYEEVESCSALDSDKYVLKVDSFYTIPTEDDMIDYVLSTGPLSGCIDSTTWDSYIDGVVTDCGTEADHCVQIVGVNTDEGYWKIRNTWGEDWGEGGYIRVSTGSNTCGVATDPLFSVVSIINSPATFSSEPTNEPTNEPTIKSTHSPSFTPTEAPVTRAKPTTTLNDKSGGDTISPTESPTSSHFHDPLIPSSTSTTSTVSTPLLSASISPFSMNLDVPTQQIVDESKSTTTTITTTTTTNSITNKSPTVSATNSPHSSPSSSTSTTTTTKNKSTKSPTYQPTSLEKSPTTSSKKDNK